MQQFLEQTISGMAEQVLFHAANFRPRSKIGYSDGSHKNRQGNELGNSESTAAEGKTGAGEYEGKIVCQVEKAFS